MEPAIQESGVCDVFCLRTYVRTVNRYIRTYNAVSNCTLFTSQPHILQRTRRKRLKDRKRLDDTRGDLLLPEVGEDHARLVVNEGSIRPVVWQENRRDWDVGEVTDVTSRDYVCSPLRNKIAIQWEVHSLSELSE